MEAGSNTHLLSLYHDPRVGALLLSRLLQEYSGFEALLCSGPDQLANHGLDKSQLAALFDADCSGESQSRAEKEIAWSSHEDQQLLCFDDAAYPSLLRQIDTPPPVLFVKGNAAALHEPCVAIVGSRNCSDYGRYNAHWFAAQLGGHGLTICSGLAQGIDTQAHRGALQAKTKTVAVLGTGIDICYPKCNAALAKTICEQGALVSEFPLGLQPRPHQFPRRNRIISGLALASLIVEANERSGSLITARLAMEQNREVLAIPGPISSPRSRGCHRLIRQGAALVEDPREIIALLVESGAITSKEETNSEDATVETHAEGMAPELKRILALVSHSGSIADSLATQSQLSWPQLNSALMQLELMGRIYRRDGRFYPRATSLHSPRD